MAKKKAKKIKKKVLCKLCKNDCLKDSFEEYLDLVKDSVYICKKCGRTAKDDQNLCKPVSMN